MELRLLGTNGWYDTKTGDTTCVFIDSKNYYLVFDAGNGIYKLDRCIKKPKPVYLFLSHFHLDHTAGLHILNKFNFTEGLTIVGQVGTKSYLDTLVNQPFTIPFGDYSYPVTMCELHEGGHDLPFRVEARKLVHSTDCFGYRIEIDGKIIAFCTDTGICDNAIRLGRNADLLITECSLKTGQTNPLWPHLNPEDAITIARQSNAKKLVLIHFDANEYRTLDDRFSILNEYGDQFKNLIIGIDNKRIVI
ncbi:MAG TPA: ribonuclease Z [Methanoregulaceae archaeon]|nr:ribonuclease Z [Methanoregulaceae archaeon]